MNRFGMTALMLGALALSACGGAIEEESQGSEAEAQDVDETNQAIQLQYPLDGYMSVIENTTSAQSRSVGVIRNVNLSPGTSHATCGATFVSRKYAVTASHCVDNIDLNTENIVVEQITTTNLNTLAIIFSSSFISGNWPNWTQGAPLGAQDGYTVTSYNCRVRRRCHPSFGGSQNCPAGVGEVDIALLECPARATAVWATTTALSTVNSNVEAFWFHEIVNLTTAPSTTDQYWLHYGKLPPSSNRNDNWHYRVRHQVFPLQSTGRPQFLAPLLPYKDVQNSGAYTQMDMPICHGTSGSGVFRAGQNVLLGPAVSGGGSALTWTPPGGGTVQNLLCHRAELTTAGVGIASHVRSAITHAFVTGSPEVLANR